MTNAPAKKDTKATETKATETKATEPTVEATKATPEATPEAKPRRKARTLEEKIAELQAQAKERAEKKEATARKNFDELTDKFYKAQDKVRELTAQLIETRGEYDFTLPADISATREEIEKLQVKAQADEAEAAAADEAKLDSETDAA